MRPFSLELSCFVVGFFSNKMILAVIFVQGHQFRNLKGQARLCIHYGPPKCANPYASNELVEPSYYFFVEIGVLLLVLFF